MKFLTILLSLGSFLGFVSRVKDFVDERSDDTSSISDRIPDTPRDDDSPSGDGVPHRVPELPDVTAQDLSGDYIVGTGADERLVGGSGSDLIVGGGGQDKIITGGGDDYAWALNASGLTGIYTQGGNDTIAASVPGSGQIHIGAGDGDDRIILDMTNETGFQAHHVYTGTGQDRIEFENIDAVDAPILGRIDDFDPSRDVLLLEGQVLDLQNLPDGVDVVAYNGQQWLRIEDKALYALEGARDGGTERHFTELPDDLTSLQVVSYADPQNFVPAEDVETAGLNRIDADSRHVMGTGEDDWITDTQVHGQSSSSGGHDHGTGSGEVVESASVHFMARDGNDVVDAGKGDDTVYGGNGDDALAGGIDNDVLYGESGADRLYGGSEQDTLDGGAGDDQLFGGTGDDLLTGGAGADHMTGGDGQDRFHFGAGDLQVWDSIEGTDDEKYAQLDVIEDFRIGEDVISFEGDVGITLDDIDAWTVEVQGSAITAVHIQSTGERFLVNVDSEEEGGQEDWSALMDDGNFSL